MKMISLKLKDDVFKNVDRVVKDIHLSRNAFINEALAYYTNLYQRKLLKETLSVESRMVSMTSLESLKEFEALEDDVL